MAQDTTIYFNEGLWITAEAPTGIALTPLDGGGGPGYGGWGLSQGHPRGTSPAKRDLAKIISTRRVLGEEYQVIIQDHDEKYASHIKQLPNQIAAERAQAAAEAKDAGGSLLSQQMSEQQNLTSRIRQIREGYLQRLPDALSFYGAPAFYKRPDSMMSRILEPGVFTSKGEAFGRELISRLNRSWDGAYRLHIEAQKHQALADDLHELARQLDQEELRQQSLDLPKAIERRTTQIAAERQICFDCLPSVLQHEMRNHTSIGDSLSLVQSLEAYHGTAAKLAQIKKLQIPTFDQQNPQIRSPLSKPQVEGLLHLVDEQRTRRAGPLWKDYHHALALTESIRYLQQFTSAIAALHQRALEVEQLQVRHQVEAELKIMAERQAKEAAQKVAAEAERKAKEAAQKAKREPRPKQAIEKPMAERKAKKAAQKAKAERKAKEAAEKVEAKRKAKEATQKAKAEAKAMRAAQKAETERRAKETRQKGNAKRKREENERQRITECDP